MRGDSGPAAAVKPVKIYSEIAAPPMLGTEIGVTYNEDGVRRRMMVNAMRPTHFEKIVVSTVYETAPAMKYENVPLNSARDVARNGYYAWKKAGVSVGKPATYPSPVLDLRNWEVNNMGHLLGDIVPYCLYAKQVMGAETTILLRETRDQFLTLLRAFGIEPVKEERRVTGAMIKIQGTRGLSLYSLPETFDCAGIQFFPDTFAGMEFAGEMRFERIFLARRATRYLTNMAEVEQVTERYGYKTLYFEDYTVAEQLSIAAHAKHAVGIHGASMALLFVNPGMGSVIELFPPNVYHEFHPTCMNGRVGRYELIIPAFDQQVAHNGWETILPYKNMSFALDPELLRGMLAEIHGA